MGTKKKTSGKEKAVVPSRAPSFSASGSGRKPNPAYRNQAPPPNKRAASHKQPVSRSGQAYPPPPRRNRSSTSARRARTKLQNKRRMARIYMAISIFVILVSIVAAGTVFFKVEYFAVYGNSHYTAEEIIRATGIAYDDNLFLMDKFRIIDKMMSEMIFLESVEIRRVLPGTLKITVSEVQIAGAIESNGEYWLCDQNGRLLEKQSTPPSNTTLIVGVTLDKPAAAKLIATEEREKQQPLLALLPALFESGLSSGVTKISLEKIYELTIWYGEGFEILLGKSDSLLDKCRRLSLLLPQLQSEGRTAARIDASGSSIHVLP
jgi:cell division protein FtsQ